MLTRFELPRDVTICCQNVNKEFMNTVAYPVNDVSPVDALWVLIQGQTKTVRDALTARATEKK